MYKYKKILLGFFLLVSTPILTKAASFVETLNNDKIEVIATYDNKMPSAIENIYKPKYTIEKPMYLDYVFITSRVANLRKQPDTNSEIL